MKQSHDSVRELLGAYALHAVPADEAGAVERHLASCPACRTEVDQHRETAALLGNATAAPPTGLWDRIAGALDAPERTPGADPRVVALPGAVRSVRWPAALAAAASLVLLAGLLAGVVRQDRRLDRMQAALAHQSRAAAALTAFDDPRGREVTLRSGDGRTALRAVVLPDGAAYLLAGRLPALSPDRTYQLWGIVAGAPVSAGVLGHDPDVVAFHVAGQVTALAVTEERSGGVVAPTRPPLATGLVT